MINKQEQEELSEKISIAMEWPRWVEEIPNLRFHKSWKVKILPPFKGAMVRFIVKKGKAKVSVFLDCHGIIEDRTKPYWQIYPSDREGNTAEFDIKDTKGLLHAISLSIFKQTEPFF